MLNLALVFKLPIPDYIKNVLIPFFDNRPLVLHSKKELDYKDWKTVLNLKELGQHYTEEGKEVISLILSQINNKRLSTVGSTLVDRNLLDGKVKKLLAAPSNFETKEDGRIFIKSLNKFYSNKNNIRVELKNEDLGLNFFLLFFSY